MKISRKTFYKNHNKELRKYFYDEIKALHIVAENTAALIDTKHIEILTLNQNNEEDFKKINNLESKFDLIVLTDIFEVSNDIFNLVSNLKNNLNTGGKLLLTSINPKWNLLFRLLETFGIKRRSYINSYINPKNVSNILESAGYENLKNYNKQIFPFKLFGIGTFLNISLELIFVYLNLGIKTYFLYELKNKKYKRLSKSIIVPAKNEEGNLEELISRIPKFDEDYEILISCGPSKDKTFEKAKSIQDINTDLNIKTFEQTRNGKANAVWEAIDKSTGEIIAILDSDISVDPEELTNFFEIIENGSCDFVNGTRLMYPMEKSAMRFINKLGNRSFQFIISKLTNTNLSDTLCGTKVFKRSNINNLKKWQSIMSISDPFCDFDLIFSNSYYGSKILEYPVHYRSRKYGKTNISRFKDGWRLILYLFNSMLLFKTSY